MPDDLPSDALGGTSLPGNASSVPDDGPSDAVEVPATSVDVRADGDAVLTRSVDGRAEPAPVPVGVAAFDPELPWRRARSVALRPEPFGALVYHFGNRKLSFLKSKMLVAVVQSLADHPTASATLTACGVPESQRPAYERALADLARSRMIEPRPLEEPA